MNLDLDTLELKIRYSELLNSEIFNTLFNNFISFKNCSKNCKLNIYQFYSYIDDFTGYTETFFVGNTKTKLIFLEVTIYDDVQFIHTIKIEEYEKQLKPCKYSDEIIQERVNIIIPNILKNKHLIQILEKEK